MCSSMKTISGCRNNWAKKMSLLQANLCKIPRKSTRLMSFMMFWHSQNNSPSNTSSCTATPSPHRQLRPFKTKCTASSFTRTRHLLVTWPSLLRLQVQELLRSTSVSLAPIKLLSSKTRMTTDRCPTAQTSNCSTWSLKGQNLANSFNRRILRVNLVTFSLN